MSQQAPRKKLTRNQRAELFLEHGGVCYLCGLRIQAERGEKWEVEHVHCREISGRDDWDNLRPAHVSCHKVKSKADKADIAKSNKVRNSNLGIPRTRKGKPLPGCKDSPIKMTFNGPVWRATGEPVRPK